MTGIVVKPWGCEYVAYRNADVAIWVLHINASHGTSLHAHPGKSTALILLRGSAQLELLRGDPIRWHGLNKINIFRGRFHRTRSFSNDTVLLEIESPDDKRNVVRLEDAYGREAQKIEDATEPMTADCLQLSDGYRGTFCGRYLATVSHPGGASAGEVLITLRGGLRDGLVPPGEAIDGLSMQRLVQKFAPLPSSLFLRIS